MVEYGICLANSLFFGVWNTPYPAIPPPGVRGMDLSPLKGGLLCFSSVGGAVILRKKVKNYPHLRRLKWGENFCSK